MLFSLRIRCASVSLHCKRDPHGHLAQRAPGQREGPAQALRAEDDVDAEGTTLPDQAVEPKAASCASLSSSTKNSWNSSTISRMRGRGGVPGTLR